MDLPFISFCSCGGGLLILLLAVSLLRFAVTIANRFVQPAKKEIEDDWGDWGDWDRDDEDDPPAKPKSKGVIPEPGIGKGMLLLLVATFLSGISFALLGFAVEEYMGLRMRREETRFFVALLNIPFANLILSFVLSEMLPTTFRRAVIVALVYNLVLLVFGLIVGIPIYLLLTLIR